MESIKLIVTDLDGTILGNDTEFKYNEKLSRIVASYRDTFGTKWVLCSGRSYSSVSASVEALREIGLFPDYVVVRSSFVYRNDRHQLQSQYAWNFKVRLRIFKSRLYLKGMLRDWQSELQSTFKNVICVQSKRDKMCLRFRNREDADAGTAILQRKAKDYPYLRVYQYLTEVEVRNVQYSKGMAVYSLAQEFGLKKSEILCIGNGHSDVCMLDGMFADHTGCPSNAEMDVIDAVHRMGGYISSGRSMEGVVEILEGYRKGEIRNALPDWWSPSHIPKQSRSAGRRRHPPRRPLQAGERTAVQILLLSAYVVLVVFASFGLVPFSGWIMKPFVLVAKFVEHIMSMLFT